MAGGGDLAQIGRHADGGTGHQHRQNLAVSSHPDFCPGDLVAQQTAEPIFASLIKP